MHLRSNAKAVRAGLKFRSPVVTTRDALGWFKSLPEERQDKPRAGLTPEREAELLSLWAQAQGQPAAAQGG
jgi:2'-hydroxyisoflavone reductase